MRQVLAALMFVGMLPAQLQVSGRSAPVNDYESSLGVQPTQQAITTTPDASNTKLIGVDVWSSATYRAFIYRVQNGAQDNNPSAVGGGAGSQAWQWRTPDPVFISLGATAAAINAYRVVVVNLDQASPADIYVSYHYGN